MKRKEIIEQLEGLAEYATDYVATSKHDATMECDDIWGKDAVALADAMVIVNMFYDIIANLEGQDILGEMVAILSVAGYTSEDFTRLGICTDQEVEQYIENYKF